MLKKVISGIMLTMLFMCLLSVALNIQPVKSEPRTIIVPDDYPTIQKAIDAANPGDTIYVRRGTYYERVNVTKTVNVVGECREETIVNGGFNISASDVLLCNFTIAAPEEICVEVHGYNVTIKRNIITNSLVGIALWTDSYKCTVTENIVEKCRDGIDSVSNDGFHSLIHNNVTGCDFGIGLALDGGNNFVYDNTITECSTVGIFILFTMDNVIEKNIVYKNGWSSSISELSAGLWIDARIGPSYIKENVILENKIGLYLGNGSGTKVFHNLFINNSQQVCLENASFSIWDDGYPFGGNYWSDYNGTDLFNGPYQNIPGSDGIGDTPYVINANNTDHYPFMNPSLAITAMIDIKSKSLCLVSFDRYISVYAELPQSIDVKSVNLSSLLLNETFKPVSTAIGDHDKDSVPDLIIKFNRTEVMSYLLAKINMTKLVEDRFIPIKLTISGKLNNGVKFEGTKLIRIAIPGPGGKYKILLT